MQPRKKERLRREETAADRKEASALGKERGGGSGGAVSVERLAHSPVWVLVSGCS